MAKKALRTSDDLDKIIERFGYAYVPVDVEDSLGRVRYRAYANPIGEDGKVDYERTVGFGWEAGLLSMPEDKLLQVIEIAIAREKEWYKEHGEQE